MKGLLSWSFFDIVPGLPMDRCHVGAGIGRGDDDLRHVHPRTRLQGDPSDTSAEDHPGRLGIIDEAI